MTQALAPCLLVLAALAGCATPVAVSANSPAVEAASAEPFALAGSAESLTEAEVERLLGAVVAVRAGGRFAVLQVTSAATSSTYGWRTGSEAGLRSREATVEALRTRLRDGGAASVEALPALLVPAEASVPALRELAVRLQVDGLLVFRASGDLYERYRLFSSNSYKAYATCEALLLDTRTGAIPFTTVVTTETVTQKNDGDFSDADAARRAVEDAVLQAVDRMSLQTMTYLRGLD